LSPPPREKYIPHVVTDKELNLILNHLKQPHYKIIVLLSAWGGLRRGEIFALKWKNVDFENCRIEINSALTLSENGYIEKPPKSANGYRTVILPEELITMLKEYRKNNFDTKYIFNISPSTLTHHFMKITKELDLDIRFHDIRHYHSNWLYKNGIPDHHAAKRMGHDIQTLKGIYQHLDTDNHKKLEEDIASQINKIQ
jgi:integrase